MKITVERTKEQLHTELRIVEAAWRGGAVQSREAADELAALEDAIREDLGKVEEPAEKPAKKRGKGG